MPWCPECDRFLSPASVRSDGSCPKCGRTVDPGKARARQTTASPGPPSSQAIPDGGDEEPLEPVPWHFKLLLGAVAIYLGYRAFQGIEWLLGQA